MPDQEHRARSCRLAPRERATWLASCSHSTMNRTQNILLVEDDPVLGPLTAESLSMRGHALTLAATADAAFEQLAAANSYSVVLLDLQLGSVHAIDLVARLRRAHARLPSIVIFSAQPSFELSRSARAIKARATLQKPCTIDQIDDAIERAVA